MSTQTTNLQMTKPDIDDYYDINIQNENLDKIDAFCGRTDNPHKVTKAQVGLGSVDNTSDMSKPISTATQTALNLKVNISDYNAKVAELAGDLSTHSSNTSNPHSVTKSQVGLANVPNVATNDQTPTYTVASSNTALTSGEKLSVAFGKIAKAISSLISHLADTKSHLTPDTNGSKLTSPLEIVLTKGSEGLTVNYFLSSEFYYKSIVGGQECSFVGGQVIINPSEMKCKGNLFAPNIYVGSDSKGYYEVLHTGNCAPVIVSSTAPTDTKAVWWDTSTNKIKRYSGSAWVTPT